MFSKGNSSKGIPFSQPSQTEDRAMIFRFKEDIQILLEKIKISF